MNANHPKVSLWQKQQGGTWYACWRDPRAENKQRNSTTGTADYGEAERVATALSRIVCNPELWESPPDGSAAALKAAEIWGVRPLGSRVDSAIAELQKPAGMAPNKKERQLFRDAIK